MNIIKVIVLGFILLTGCSCERESWGVDAVSYPNLGLYGRNILYDNVLTVSASHDSVYSIRVHVPEGEAVRIDVIPLDPYSVYNLGFYYIVGSGAGWAMYANEDLYRFVAIVDADMAVIFRDIGSMEVRYYDGGKLIYSKVISWGYITS